MKLDYRLKLNRYLCGLALLVLLLLPQISFASLVPTVATINGNPISIEDFNWALGRAQRDMVRQGQQIDMSFIAAVMPGNETRQHSRVWRVQIPANQGKTHAGKRIY